LYLSVNSLHLLEGTSLKRFYLKMRVLGKWVNMFFLPRVASEDSPETLERPP
jgi:hypothetical protein